MTEIKYQKNSTNYQKIKFKVIVLLMQKKFFAQKKILNHPTVVLQPFIPVSYTHLTLPTNREV